MKRLSDTFGGFRTTEVEGLPWCHRYISFWIQVVALRGEHDLCSLSCEKAPVGKTGQRMTEVSLP